jgi:hypothetical protein
MASSHDRSYTLAFILQYSCRYAARQRDKSMSEAIPHRTLPSTTPTGAERISEAIPIDLHSRTGRPPSAARHVILFYGLSHGHQPIRAQGRINDADNAFRLSISDTLRARGLVLRHNRALRVPLQRATELAVEVRDEAPGQRPFGLEISGNPGRAYSMTAKENWGVSASFGPTQSATDLASAVRTGDLDPVRAVTDALARISASVVSSISC